MATTIFPVRTRCCGSAKSTEILCGPGARSTTTMVLLSLASAQRHGRVIHPDLQVTDPRGQVHGRGADYRDDMDV